MSGRAFSESLNPFYLEAATLLPDPRRFVQLEDASPILKPTDCGETLLPHSFK